MKTIKIFLIVAFGFLAVLDAGAVLKESSMGQTLGVLCEELSDTHREHKEMMQRFEQRN